MKIKIKHVDESDDDRLVKNIKYEMEIWDECQIEENNDEDNEEDMRI